MSIEFTDISDAQPASFSGPAWDKIKPILEWIHTGNGDAIRNADPVEIQMGIAYLFDFCVQSLLHMKISDSEISDRLDRLFTQHLSID